jgi:subtilisin family serine protease
MRPIQPSARPFSKLAFSKFAVALPAALALATGLVWLPASDATAQGFGFQRKGGGNTGFVAQRKATVINKSSRPNGSSTGAANSGQTGKLTGVKPNGGRPDGGKKPGGNTVVGDRNPGRDKPHRWPLPPIVPPVIVDGSGARTNQTFTGGGSGGGPSNAGPTNQIVRPRPGTGVPPANDRSYVPDEVLIELATNTTDETAEALARRARLTQLESFDFDLAGTKLYRWRIQDPDRRTVPAVIRELERTPGVISASANFIARLQDDTSTELAKTTEPSTSPLEQYALAKLQLPQAHALARGDKILIAIIDGGVDTTHPELTGVIVDTFDAIGSGEIVHPHGTAVAGAIASQVRLKGTAPAAQILAARAFGNDRRNSEGTGFNIAKAITWAVSRNARIINLSFAGSRDPKVEIALRAARARGIVLVAAAGNDGPSSAPRYPAADPNVIAVTATDEDDKLFHAAVRGKHIAVAAPGVDLWLPSVQGTYQEISGTSFSAAEVSGTVALLLERRPDLDPESVRRTLMTTARDLGPRGIDPQFGAGLVDAYKALLALSTTAAAER